jgi:hypothetical protein
MDLVAGSACLVPGAPAVTLLDDDGAALASAAATSDADVLVANRTDFRVGWASWCGALPRGPLHLRLDLRSGSIDTGLPDGFVASCQQVPTMIDIEAVQP